MKMTIPWPILLIFILIVILFTVFNYSRIENHFVFFPDPLLRDAPQTLRIPYEDVYFMTPDGQKLNGWLFIREKSAPILLLCHGNGGNISYWLDHARMLINQNLNVFMFDYRGYGKSSGKPSEQGLYQDSLAAYDFLIKENGIRGNEIIPYGISLGGAVAIEIARQRTVKSLILEGAFTSSKDMAGSMPLFAIFSSLLPAHYNNLAKIKQIQVPKLIIHGEVDKIVPFKMGQQLYTAAGEPKFFLPVKNAGHNDVPIFGGNAYYQTIAQFARASKI
ncbi:MAG: alpha/beta hydrolase [Desulfobacteraceae bacterium]|nr:MAG: alpha/beta hydrolase [Desulfobacteraceae bacterium]